MFSFIGKIVNGIFQLMNDVILVVIIVLFVVLLVIATNRHNNNPYIDHSDKIQKAKVEAERDAEYKAALQRLYNEYRK